jgi:cytochrome P450
MHADTIPTPAGGSFSGTVIDPLNGPPVGDMARLTSFSEVNEVLKSPDFLHVVGHRDNAPFIGGSLLSLSGDPHFARRRIAAPLFGPQALARYEHEVFLPALAEAIGRWPTDRDGRRRGDLTEAIQRALSRLAGAMVGLDGLEDEATLARHILYTSRISVGVNIEFVERDHADVVAECLPFVARFRDEFFIPALERRSAEEAKVAADGRSGETAAVPDLITLIIRNKAHYEAAGQDAALRDAILFNGASGGISHAACNVLNALLPWRDAAPADRRPLLADPAFLRRAALEAIRLRPATPFQIRRARRAHALSSGRQVADGEFVLLDMTAATHDRSVFGETADVFDPFRTPVERVKPTGLAFSNGPHTCIAMNLSIGNAASADAGPQGLLIALLQFVLQRDLRRDGQDEARPRAGTTRAEFDLYPVSLAALPQAETA